jgi:hypothetical protein
MNAMVECRALELPKLVVAVGYGPELPVYHRARALWEFYASHFPGVDILFVRDSQDLPRGEMVFDGNDLVVGLGPLPVERENSYATTGKWSAEDNAQQIYRQIAVYDYLLRVRTEPFYLYQATVTSVVDFRGLAKVMSLMPETGCYAGMPAQLATPDEVKGLVFCCINTLLSRDVVSSLRQRYEASDERTLVPNDVWQGLLLRDLPRIPVPVFSYTKARNSPLDCEDIGWKTQRLMEMGHFHFRIKTASEQDGLPCREAVDPWIMLKIMQTILTSPAYPEATRQMLVDMATFSDADETGTIPAVMGKPIFHTHKRRVAIDESDFPA